MYGKIKGKVEIIGHRLAQAFFLTDLIKKNLSG